MEIRFVSPATLFQDLQGNSGLNNALNVTLPYNFYLTEGEQQFIELTGNTFSTATMSGLLINLAVAMILGTTMEAMWSLLNAVQLLNFLPLINVDVPANMNALFELLGFANMDIQLVEEAFVNYMIEADELEQEPYNEHFEDYGLESHSILVNSAAPLMLWALVVFTFPFSFAFSKILPCHNAKRKFRSIIDGYTYNTLLRALIESYLDLIISSSVNMTRLNLNNKTERISSAVTLMFTGILYALPFFMLHKLSRPRYQLLDKRMR